MCVQEGRRAEDIVVQAHSSSIEKPNERLRGIYQFRVKIDQIVWAKHVDGHKYQLD